MRTAILVMHNDSLCHCLKYMSETPKQTINMKQKISDEEELNELEKSDLPYGVLVVLCNWPGCSMCQCKFYKLNVLRTRIHLPFPLSVSCSFFLFPLSIFISATQPDVITPVSPGIFSLLCHLSVAVQPVL